MKKILAVLLVLAMVISVAPAAFAANTGATENEAIELDQDQVKDASLAAGETIYYSLFNHVGLTVCVTGEGLEVETGAYARGKYNYSPVESENGAASFVVEDDDPRDWNSPIIKITNKGDASVTYSITWSAPVGTFDYPELITDDSNLTDRELDAYGEYYYEWTAAESGVLSVYLFSANAGWKVSLYNCGNDESKYILQSDDDPGCEMNVSAGDLVKITVYAGNDEALKYTLLVNFAKIGTVDNPESIGVGSATAHLSGATYEYYYSWTVDKKGKLTVTVDTENNDDWGFSINGGDIHGTDDVEGGWCVDRNNTEVIDVNVGDKVMIYITHFGYDDHDVTFSLSFVETEGEGEGNETEDGNGSGSGDSNNDADPVLEEKLADYTNEYTGDSFTVTPAEGYKYTVIKFVPDVAGIYTITAPEGVHLSWWNGNDQAVFGNLTEEESETLEISYESGCIWVGVRADEAVQLTVVKSGDIEEDKTPDNVQINHEHNEDDKITSAGDFNIGEDDWEWVDVEDDVIDKAVLGDDGYYHLNSKDGPILFIDFNGIYENFQGLINMYQEGRGGVYGNIPLEAGNYEKHIYNELIKAYLDAEEDGVYALNEELIDMMKTVGKGQGWYNNDQDSSARLGLFDSEVNPDEAWMFLCKYAVEKEDDSKDEGKKDDSPVIEPDNKDEDKKDDSSVVEPDNKDNTEDKNDNKVPATADNSALVLSLVAMVVAMAGVAVVLTNKKKIA